MVELILDWIGTFCIIIAAVAFSSKKAGKPKIRLFTLSLFFISNIFWIPLAIIVQTYGLLVTQIILFILNLRGIINCINEIKRG